MHTRRAIGTVPRGRLARRLLIALALALVITIGVAGAALAAPGHTSTHQRTPAAQTEIPATADTTAEDSASPVVPLVFAGILLLAVASPALPRYSRYGPSSRGEHW